MSDDPTREIPDPRPFEERVFARFDTFDARFDRLDARMDRFESRIESKVDTLDGKVDTLDGRLTTLEEKVDARLRETRPIWEAMQTRLESVEKEVKTVRRSVMLLHEDNLAIRGDLRELLERSETLDERVGKLESESRR